MNKLKVQSPASINEIEFSRNFSLKLFIHSLSEYSKIKYSENIYNGVALSNSHSNSANDDFFMNKHKNPPKNKIAQ